MRLSSLANRANCALDVLKWEGVGSLLRKIRHRSGFYDAADGQWRRQKFAVDKAFDSKHGVQTGGIQDLFDMKIKGNSRRLGRSHVACDPEEFERGLAAANVDHSHFTFIDLGSGKGRALMLAAHHPFRRIIGVEFAEELHRAAEENFRKLAATGGLDNRIELVHEDAGEYTLPDDPLLVFLYNSFHEELMRKVAATVLESYRLSPRKISIYYLNPMHENAWTEAGYQLTAKGKGFAILIPP
jgi:SAM-dependent methyltransferase